MAYAAFSDVAGTPETHQAVNFQSAVVEEPQTGEVRANWARTIVDYINVVYACYDNLLHAHTRIPRPIPKVPIGLGNSFLLGGLHLGHTNKQLQLILKNMAGLSALLRVLQL
jgi:hypothetical protein